jgi:predicted GTPase
MGYSEAQRRELEETINRTPCDVVVVATPIDLGRVLKLNKPSVRVGYEIEEITKPSLLDLLTEFSAKMQEQKPVLV